MGIAPGLVFLVKSLPYVIYPSAVAYGLIHAFAPDAPLPAVAAALVLAHPVFWFLEDTYREWQIKRAAAAVGAVTAPSVPSALPGGLSHMKFIRQHMNSGEPSTTTELWAEQMGTYVYQLNLQGDRRIVTLEPDHVKAILATKFEDFDKGPFNYDVLHSLLGNGVFNADGEMWKFHRSMTRPFFNKEKIAHFDIFDRHADDLLRKVKTRLAEGFPIDFQDMIARFTLDSATEFLFGYDINSSGAGLPYPEYAKERNPETFTKHPSNVFVKAFAEGQELTVHRYRAGSAWRLVEFFSDSVNPRREVVNDYVKMILNDPEFQKAAQATEKGNAADSASLLHHLVSYTKDPKVLTDEIINLLVAGRDTTMGTLSFGVYKLTAHPEIAQRLREEVLEVVGPNRRPTYEDVRDMKYLRAFLNEVLRLYPVVPNNSRAANKDTTLPFKDKDRAPIFVPKGTRCSYSSYLIHRRKDLWGPTAGVFDPDRFLDERHAKYLVHNPYIFIPFNAGPRICLGQQFAYNEMSFFLIRLLQNFEAFELAREAQPKSSFKPEGAPKKLDAEDEELMFASHLTMSVKDGLWVHMREAPVA
ncbi:cytochrome P450 [Schizophyllum commune Tattone D]|nr:cytochrome P450 [Schizophyllum commune Tattone D]